MAAQHDDRYFRGLRLLAHELQDPEAVHAGQLEVEHDQARQRRLAQVLRELAAVRRGAHRQPFELEYALEQPAHDLVVLDDDHRGLARGGGAPRRGARIEDEVAAAGGSADVALDLLGTARSTSTTLSCLRALKRGGRLVLMGSADVPLELSFREMLANDWEVVGQFMYTRQSPGQLGQLAAEGLLDLKKIVVTTFKLADFKRAVEAAALMQGLDLTAVVP